MGRPGTIAVSVAACCLALLLAVTLSGCGQDGPGSEAHEFINLLNEKKFGEAYDMLAASSPARSVTREEFVRRAEAGSAGAPDFENFRILEEEIDGDRATVKWTAVTSIPDQDETTTEQELSLVREDGRWKIWQ